jgi:hypothetical protein
MGRFYVKMIRRALFIGAFLAPISGNVASAAIITIDATALTNIYSQPSFGNRPISVHVLASATIFDASLLNLNSDAKVATLFNLGPDSLASKIIDAYFVDSITFCGGGPIANVIGCGSQPGNDLAVVSSFAATDTLNRVLGHEIGHNLGLGHIGADCSATGNLMNPCINSSILTSAQVTTIFLNGLGLVKGNAESGFFIEVRPILVSAAVPELSTWFMMIIGFGMVGLVVRRRHLQASAKAS